MIVIKKFFEGGEMWVDEDYTTTEEDKNEDLLAYGEIFGYENVRLVLKEDWENEHTSVLETNTSVIKSNTSSELQNIRESQDIREEQDKEYRKCLKEDRKREEQIKQDEKKNRPSLEDLRQLRLKHFDYSKRRMTRSSTKKLCKNL